MTKVYSKSLEGKHPQIALVFKLLWGSAGWVICQLLSNFLPSPKSCQASESPGACFRLCCPGSCHIPLCPGSTLFLIHAPSSGVVNLRRFLSLEEDCIYVLVSLWIFFTVSLPVLSHLSSVCLLGCRYTQNPGIQLLRYPWQLLNIFCRGDLQDPLVKR